MVRGNASFLSRINYLPGHCYAAALKSRACGTPKICHLIAAFWHRCRSNHDLPHPIISLFLFRILEHTCSSNRLATTRHSFQNPPAVHFASLPPYPRIRHLVGSATTLCSALFDEKTWKKSYELDTSSLILPHHGWVHASRGRKAGAGTGGKGLGGVIKGGED